MNNQQRKHAVKRVDQLANEKVKELNGQKRKVIRRSSVETLALLLENDAWRKLDLSPGIERHTLFHQAFVIPEHESEDREVQAHNDAIDRHIAAFLKERNRVRDVLLLGDTSSNDALDLIDEFQRFDPEAKE